MSTIALVEDRSVRRRMAALSLIPQWDLARLGAAGVLVAGGGLLVDEVVRALGMLGVGMIGVIGHEGDDGGPWMAEPSVSHVPCGRNVLAEGKLIPRHFDAAVWCGADGSLRAVLRRATFRSGVPRIEVQLDVFHGSLTTWLPDQPFNATEGATWPGSTDTGPASPAMASVMGGLAAQETAKVLLRDFGYPNLSGRLCLVDGQTYAMRVLETA